MAIVSLLYSLWTGVISHDLLLCWALWERQAEKQWGTWEFVSALKRNHLLRVRDCEAAAEKALGGVGQITRLGFGREGEQLGSVVLQPAARGKCQSVKVPHLPLRENKSRLTRRRSEKWVPVGRHGHSSHQRQFSLIGLLRPMPHQTQDRIPSPARVPQPAGQGSEAGKHWVASHTRFCLSH